MSSNLLMSVLCLNVRRLCVPNIMSLGICFIEKIAPHQSWRVCLIVYSIKISVIFGVRFERRKVDRKSKPTQKLKHANSILESFEYFCQMLSKLIFIMLSYNVSKFARFLWDTMYSALWTTYSLERWDAPCDLVQWRPHSLWRKWSFHQSVAAIFPLYTPECGPTVAPLNTRILSSHRLSSPVTQSFT